MSTWTPASNPARWWRGIRGSELRTNGC
jgi:hypothetical protein